MNGVFLIVVPEVVKPMQYLATNEWGAASFYYSGMSALNLVLEDCGVTVTNEMNGNSAQSRREAYSFEDIRDAGPPEKPLDFPSPVFLPARQTSSSVIDRYSRQIHDDTIIIVPKGKPNAFTIEREQSGPSSSFRSVWVKPKTDRSEHTAMWETTQKMYSIKCSAITDSSNCTALLREVAALQLSGDYHPNILHCKYALRDGRFLYAVFPRCRATLHHVLKSLGDLESRDREVQVRTIFKDIVYALKHLSKKGICHMNISLESLKLSDEGKVLLTDFSKAIRVPYSTTTLSPANSVTDVSSGTCPRLIRASSLDRVSDESFYTAPELLRRDPSFDAFAIDVWSAGVILFILLVGRAPFRVARETDLRYNLIKNGKLWDLVNRLNLSMSSDACSLVQGILRASAKRRYSLHQVAIHQWLAGHTEHTKLVLTLPTTPCRGRREKSKSPLRSIPE